MPCRCDFCHPSLSEGAWEPRDAWQRQRRRLPVRAGAGRARLRGSVHGLPGGRTGGTVGQSPTVETGGSVWARGGAERRAGPRRNQGRDQGRWVGPIGRSWAQRRGQCRSGAKRGYGRGGNSGTGPRRVGQGRGRQGGSFRWGQDTGRAWELLWCGDRVGTSPDPGVARC